LVEGTAPPLRGSSSTAERIARAKALVGRLAHVVVVLPVEQLDVQRDPRRLRHRVEPVLDQLGVPFAELLLREAQLPHEVRPPRDVERDAHQRLVHRRIGGAVAADPALVAERLAERLAERDRAVLGGVVLVDVQVALHFQPDVDQRMAAELLDHVVEEADPGRNVVGAGPVEVDLDEDVGLCRLAGDPAGAHGDALYARVAAKQLPPQAGGSEHWA
jgi:hypothetical protein